MDRQPGRVQSYRTIAPRQVDLQGAQMPISSAPEESKTKRASMACLECKKRRTKCTTTTPCSECLSHGRQCIYDQSADKRRKEHAMTTKNQLQVTQENLDYYHKLLEDILESIRHSDPDQLRQLVEAVRQTPRYPRQEPHNDYATILKVVYTILGEFEDAEGSDTMSEIA
ncbi:hypothetical protein PISL3812_01795 [Talaromyces islandicus]|uniref:Zn(2)-C6 fungal-type domain-containing protein n=1 Tax=Talaromyces islandicus TaxID=28573 RepID=A0A0U1LPU2_TALIS|nr:hypothetical protein PISL3812_01795 [Talaromyces islandicus]